MTIVSTKPEDTSWQVESEHLHSGSGRRQESGVHAAGNDRSTHANTNSNATLLQGPDLLSDCSQADASDKNAAACVDSRRVSATNKKSFESPLPPPPLPPISISDDAELFPPPPLPPISISDDAELLPPPPLPPKIGRHLPEQFSVADSNHGECCDHKSSALGQPKENWNILQSNISIPDLAPQTSSGQHQCTMLVEKMIQEGFYSVPSKLPTLPSSPDQSDSIQQALDELDCATKCLEHFSLKNNSDNRSRDCPGMNQQMLVPISMSFPDHYIAPDYGNSNAISSFAVEPEASLDRMRESMSGEHLDEQRSAALPVSRPRVGTLPGHDGVVGKEWDALGK